jgi:hypothetical protein
VRWYVPGALWEETARPTRALAVAAIAALSIAVSACGNDKPRQDADEPEGNFPVVVNAAKFPTDQRLAQTSDLRLEIENTGNDEVPNLAVTIWTGDEKAGGSFQVRSDQPGLADPNRPVWVLENGYPKLLTPGVDQRNLDQAPTAGADVAQTDTFAFGPVAPGDNKDVVWRLTPVVAGTYTIHYELAAGLTGKAKAVTADGSRVEGEFVVTISSKPPRASVDANGKVVLQGN